MKKKLHQFHPGDKVRLLHLGKPIKRIAVVREVLENGCLIADFIDREHDELPLIDYKDHFVRVI